MAYGGLTPRDRGANVGRRGNVVQRGVIQGNHRPGLPRRRSGPGRALVKRDLGGAFYPPQYGLGYDDGFGGFSFKKTFRKLGKGVTNVGHAIGRGVTSKIGQGVLGTALAVTGVGAPAAALIFAGTKGVGNLIKPGGNLKHFATGAAQGAVEGVVAVGAGRAVRKVAGRIRTKGVTGFFKRGAKAAGGQAADIAGSIVSPSQQSDVLEQTQAAQAAAEEARAQAAQQAAEYQAQLIAAQQAGADAQAEQLRAQIEQLNAQAAAATQAAQAAQAATSQVQAGGQDSSTLQSLLQAATQAAGAAQMAAAAPPTPQATQQVYDAAQSATDAVTDAAAGEPIEAGILGGVNPVVLIGGVALIAMMTGKPKRRRSSRRR